jgi:hypothetical protein
MYGILHIVPEEEVAEFSVSGVQRNSSIIISTSFHPSSLVCYTDVALPGEDEKVHILTGK